MGIGVSKDKAKLIKIIEKDPGGDGLTESRKKIVQQSWVLAQKSGTTTMGVKIFAKLFKDERIESIFGFEQSDDEDVYIELVRQHAKRFMTLLGGVVKHVDTFASDVRPLLRKLGDRHGNISGFQIEYYDTFSEAMLQTWEEIFEFADQRHKNVMHNAWRELLKYILREMKMGLQKPSTEQAQNYGVETSVLGRLEPQIELSLESVHQNLSSVVEPSFVPKLIEDQANKNKQTNTEEVYR